MKIGQAVKMAAKSIFANKARSALTMLGIIIGLAAVIVLVSYAQGQNLAMEKLYSSMGANKISVSAYSWDGSSDVSQLLYDYCMKLSETSGGLLPQRERAIPAHHQVRLQDPGSGHRLLQRRRRGHRRLRHLHRKPEQLPIHLSWQRAVRHVQRLHHRQGTGSRAIWT